MNRPIRPGQGTINQTRYQGMGCHASDREELLTQRKHIVTLIDDAIKDETEAEKSYRHLLSEIAKNKQSLPNASEVSELIEHISNQEQCHKNLLKRIINFL